MQRSFSGLGYGTIKWATWRERFLGEIDAVMPWDELLAELAPTYPRSGKMGHQPVGPERMLRMYIAQQCLALSDEGAEAELPRRQAHALLHDEESHVDDDAGVSGRSEVRRESGYHGTLAYCDVPRQTQATEPPHPAGPGGGSPC
jgi:hypothetical protein